MRKKLFSILALLCLTVTSAWAQDSYNVTFAQGLTGWTADPSSATEGQTVTLTYSGSKQVANVTAKATAVAPEGYITVYFTDAQNYSQNNRTVKIYYDGSSGTNPAWPGTSMTWVRNNQYSQPVYKAEIPDDVTVIVFNNKNDKDDTNGEQTVDIVKDDIFDCGWWYTGEKENGKYKVEYTGIYTTDVTVSATANNPNVLTFTMPKGNVKVEDVAFYTASWIGKSAIQVNGTWYNAEGTLDGWDTAGAFNEKDLGVITELVLGGEAQTYDGGNNWNNTSLTLPMYYKIDSGATQSVNMNWFKHENNNNIFQTGGDGAAWAPQTIDISGLAPGNHTIAVWFTFDNITDNNSGANYVATFSYAPATYTVTTHLAGGAYWSTFYSQGNYKAPDDTQVFAVKLNGTTLEMTEIENRIVKSEQGVVLKKTTTGNITMTKTNDGSDFDFNTYNGLGGTMEGITTTGANNYYVLGGNDNGAGFYKLASGGAIGANKAYLTYPSSAREFFLFNDDATRIEMPMVESSDADAVVYDLQGRRVAQPTKGLYIVNGKKVIIK